MSTSPRRRSRRSASTRARRKPSPTVTVAVLSAHDRLLAVKKSLEATRTALSAVDQNALSDTEHEKWANELDRVNLAINTVRNSLLEGIAEEFKAEMPRIQTSTGRLQADLARLQKSVDVINAVAGFLGVIEKIITLGR